MDKKEYYFADATRDAFRILSERGVQTLIVFLLFWMSGTIANYMSITAEIKVMGWLVTIPNNVMMDCLTIALIVFVANYFEGQGKERLIIPTIKEKLMPLIITNIFLAIILGVALLGGAFVVMGFLSLVLKSGSAVISIVITIAVTVFIAVKFAFIAQCVVTRDAYYGDAINHSMEVSKGLGPTILGIIIVPELVSILPQYLLAAQMASQPIVMSIGLGLIMAMTGIYNVAAITALYYNTDLEKAYLVEEPVESDALEWND